jgi:FkbM family methyltransferase
MVKEMKTIFIDCGSNIGQGYEKLTNDLQLDNDEVYMFEPNKNCYDRLVEKYSNNKNIHINQKAVWNKNEIRILNFEFCPNENGLYGGATNILGDNFKIPGYISDEYMEEWPPKVCDQVECIDFSEFVQKNIDLNQNIILKIDIEGSEYEVIDKMIDDDILMYINTIAVEWHPHMRKDNCKDISYYLNQFEKYNINYIQWF